MFFGKIGTYAFFHVGGPMFFTSKVVALGQIFITRYGARQKNIVCQSYIPGKLKHQFTQTGPIVLELNLLELGFLIFRVFHCF